MKNGYVRAAYKTSRATSVKKIKGETFYQSKKQNKAKKKIKAFALLLNVNASVMYEEANPVPSLYSSDLVALSETCRQRFSTGTPVSFPPSSVNPFQPVRYS